VTKLKKQKTKSKLLLLRADDATALSYNVMNQSKLETASTSSRQKGREKDFM